MPNKQKGDLKVTTEPSYEQVRRAVKTALYSPDPWKRAQAAAKLELWDLPIAPSALSIAVRREAIPLTLEDTAQ